MEHIGRRATSTVCLVSAASGGSAGLGLAIHQEAVLKRVEEGGTIKVGRGRGESAPDDSQKDTRPTSNG